MKEQNSNNTENTQSYEANLAALQAIVNRMEAGDLTLDELTNSYEEGLKLLDTLNKQLNKARERIEFIQNSQMN